MVITVTSFLGSSRAFAQSGTDSSWGDYTFPNEPSQYEDNRDICPDSVIGCGGITSEYVILRLPEYPGCDIKVHYNSRGCPKGKLIDVRSFRFGFSGSEACNSFKKDMDTMLYRAYKTLGDTTSKPFFREIRNSIFMQIAKSDFTRDVLDQYAQGIRDQFDCNKGYSNKKTYINVKGTCMKVVYIPKGSTIDSNYSAIMDSNGFVYSGVSLPSGGAITWGGISNNGVVLDIPVTPSLDTSWRGQRIEYHPCGSMTCCNVGYTMCYDTSKSDKIGVTETGAVNNDTNSMAACSKFSATPPRPHYKGELEFPCGRYCKEKPVDTRTIQSGRGISSNSDNCQCHNKTQRTKATNTDKTTNTSKPENIKESKAKQTSGKYNR